MGVCIVCGPIVCGNLGALLLCASEKDCSNVLKHPAPVQKCTEYFPFIDFPLMDFFGGNEQGKEQPYGACSALCTSLLVAYSAGDK